MSWNWLVRNLFHWQSLETEGARCQQFNDWIRPTHRTVLHSKHTRTLEDKQFDAVFLLFFSFCLVALKIGSSFHCSCEWCPRTEWIIHCISLFLSRKSNFLYCYLIDSFSTMPYPQVPQQQTLYGQQFPPPPPPSMAPVERKQLVKICSSMSFSF